MKVHELIAALQKLDPALDVYSYNEDESIQAKGHPYRIFHIDGVDVTLTRVFRDENGAPAYVFDGDKGARPIAYINITSDF